MQDAHRIVDVLRHCRHEYLNDIQLIKSYTALGRPEKVQEIIDDITYRARQESSLSSLKAPRLAEFLLTYNWNHPLVPISLEVGTGEGDWSHVEEEALELVQQFTGWMEKAADISVEPSLEVILQEEQEKQLVFYFTGKLRPEENPLFLEKKALELTWSSSTVYGRIPLDT